MDNTNNTDDGMVNQQNLSGPLSEDNDTPFSPPPSIDSDGTNTMPQLDPTHPSTDSNIQPEEVYEEGLAGGAEASEPNQDNMVVGYDPDLKAPDRSANEL